jgi:hypothetical protein
MAANVKSIGTHEKFNKKVVKFLKSLGGVSTNNPNYPDQYLIDTIAGPLKVTVFPAKESAVFSIYGKFTNLERLEEVIRTNKLPSSHNVNSTNGKYNFMHTTEKRTFEEFSIAMTKIHAPGIDVVFTVKIKEGKNPPEFIAGMGNGILEQRTVTYKVSEEEFRSPMCQLSIQEAAQSLLAEWFDVNIEIEQPKKNRNGKK